LFKNPIIDFINQEISAERERSIIWLLQLFLRHKQTKLRSMPIWNPFSEYQPRTRKNKYTNEPGREVFRDIKIIDMAKYRARICKLLRRSGIDSKESILSAYVAWRAGATSNRVTNSGSGIQWTKGGKFGHVAFLLYRRIPVITLYRHCTCHKIICKKLIKDYLSKVLVVNVDTGLWLWTNWNTVYIHCSFYLHHYTTAVTTIVVIKNRQSTFVQRRRLQSLFGEKHHGILHKVKYSSVLVQVFFSSGASLRFRLLSEHFHIWKFSTTIIAF
jgi:hypothetical protein